MIRVIAISLAALTLGACSEDCDFQRWKRLNDIACAERGGVVESHYRGPWLCVMPDGQLFKWEVHPRPDAKPRNQRVFYWVKEAC